MDEKEAMFSCRLVSQKRGSAYAAAKLANDPKLSINPRKEYDFKEALKNVSSSGKSASNQRAKYPGKEGECICTNMTCLLPRLMIADGERERLKDLKYARYGLIRLGFDW